MQGLPKLGPSKHRLSKIKSFKAYLNIYIIQGFNPPSSRFAHVHIHLICPVLPSQGFKYFIIIIIKYCLTAVDHTLVRHIPTWRHYRRNCRTRVLLWMDFSFRMAAKNHNRSRDSLQFRNLSKLTGSDNSTTAAYHPAANGLVERFHRQLKAAIMRHAKDDWYEVLPVVLLGIRTDWKEDTSPSFAELVYREPLRLPSDLFNTSPTEVTDYSDFLFCLRTHVRK